MKSSLFSKTIFCTLALLSFFAFVQSQNTQREYYQLKTYTLANEKQETLVDSYLKDALLPALKRMNIRNVGVFKMHPHKYVLSNKIYVLIPFTSLDKLYSMDGALWKDAAYQKAGMEYLQTTYDQTAYERINTIVMYAFKDMPKMEPSAIEGPRKDRVYELRSYESHTEKIFKNKVDMFNAGGEVVLFDELGFNAVFYAEVLSGDKMPNLMYMTTFKNREIRDERWKAFSNAPKWKEISSMPKYQNNVSHIDRLFLYPTEYSDY